MIFTLKWLYPYWKKNIYRMIGIIFLGLITAVLQTLTPIMVKNIVNGLSHNANFSYIKENVIYMLLIGLASYFTGILAQRNRAYMNFKIELEIRQDLFSHILTLDHSLYYKHTVGDILTRLVDDISEKIAWFSCSGVFRFIQAILTIIAVITAMLYLNPVLSMWALIPVPLILLLSIKVGKKLNKSYGELQNSISEIYDFLETSFSAIRLIKANSKEKSQTEYFKEKAQNQVINEIKTGKLQVIFRYFYHYTWYISSFLIYIAGGMMIINGEIKLGELIAFQFFSGMIISPLMDISQFFISGNRAEASIKRVNEILMMKPVFIKSSKTVMINSIENIKFDGISFKPNNYEKNILEDIGFEYSRLKKLAIVGKIGSGKSTVLKLIIRLLEYTEGEYRINEINARDIPKNLIRDKIAYVPQEPSIFSSTIEDNITLFSKDIDINSFEKAIKVAQLEEDISKFPKGIHTQVGNRGFSISGGQKQRICLARALLKNPEIILIDDATNAMDANTEENFWNDLNKFYPQIGSIIVTHRTKTIENSDIILVMDNGKIVERGRHKDLIIGDTLYKKIYERAKLEEN
jgi:ATP-binding cassette subfamily B protein